MTIIADNAKATVQWPSNYSIGPEGVFRVFAAGEDAFDFDSPYVARPIDPWPTKCPGGYGSGPYGGGGYGHGYYGFGYGQGPYGLGPYGRGCEMLEATGAVLPDDDYRFAVVGYDRAGNNDPVGDRIEATATLAGVPEPAGVPTATWQTGTLTLGFELSEDEA